jgi:glycosyltransferase involved in cell wall biosynthesis
MAMGRAVVTTDVRGCNQTVIDGKTGLLVPVRDAPALAAAMCQLAGDADLRTTMGFASRRLAEERFDADVVAASVMDALL